MPDFRKEASKLLKKGLKLDRLQGGDADFLRSISKWESAGLSGEQINWLKDIRTRVATGAISFRGREKPSKKVRAWCLFCKAKIYTKDTELCDPCREKVHERIKEAVG